MTCTDVVEHDLAERYLLGRLDEAERDAFEQHYFECARCYSQVQALGAVRDALARRPARPGAGWRTWMAIAAALVLTVSAAVAWKTLTGARAQPAATIAASDPAAQQAAGTDDLARLAAVAPPPYEPSQLRSGPAREAFTSGMTRYTARDFAGA